jgi:hypothetical protein
MSEPAAGRFFRKAEMMLRPLAGLTSPTPGSSKVHLNSSKLYSMIGCHALGRSAAS